MNKEKLISLKLALKHADEVKVVLDASKAQWETENETDLNNLNMLREEINVLKEGIKVEALTEFKATENKSLLGGIGIRVSEKPIYKEEDALAWATEHGMCLKLNRASFEKVTQIQEIDFVITEEKITVTFPSEIKLEGDT